MTNLLDTENEGIEDPESDRREDSNDLKFLERLIDKASQRLEDGSFYGKLRANLQMSLLTLKKTKKRNPKVQQVQ